MVRRQNSIGNPRDREGRESLARQHALADDRQRAPPPLEEGVPADVLSASLYARFRSRQDHTFAEKVLSAMRQKFGGHVEQSAG